MLTEKQENITLVFIDAWIDSLSYFAKKHVTYKHSYLSPIHTYRSKIYRIYVVVSDMEYLLRTKRRHSVGAK